MHIQPNIPHSKGAFIVKNMTIARFDTNRKQISGMLPPKKSFLARTPLLSRDNLPLQVKRPEQNDKIAIITAARALLSFSPSSLGTSNDDHSRSTSNTVPDDVIVPVLSRIVTNNYHDDTEASESESGNENENPNMHWTPPSIKCPSAYYCGSTSLALEEDDESLSPLHCFMRRYCVEAFTATDADMALPRYGKSSGRRIIEGQVGIRCIHCKHRSQKQERAVCFPSSLKNIYHSIETWQRRHSLACRDIPAWIKVNMAKLMSDSRSGAGGRRQYWEESARRIGIVETDYGLRFSHKPGVILPRIVSKETVTFKPSPEKSSLSKPVVTCEDKDLVTGYLYVLLEQMETCQFSDQDRSGGRSKIKDCPLGFPGMQCKHCGGKAGFGRYFPTTLRALTSANSDRNIYNHIMKCRRCPSEIRESLHKLHEEQNQSNEKNRRGWRKMFFKRVWHKLHNTPSIRIGCDGPESR